MKSKVGLWFTQLLLFNIQLATEPNLQISIYQTKSTESNISNQIYQSKGRTLCLNSLVLVQQIVIGEDDRERYWHYSAKGRLRSMNCLEPHSALKFQKLIIVLQFNESAIKIIAT